MKYSICNETFQGWPLDKAMEFAAQTGYEAIEIAPFTLARSVTEIAASRRQEIRKTAERFGLSISAIHWVLARTEGLHVTHPDTEVRRRTSRYLEDLVQFGADVGAPFLIFGSPKQRDLQSGITASQGRDWALETFAPAVRIAEAAGVTICLEPLAPTETNFLNTAAEVIELIERFRSPAARLILDVKAMSSESKSIPDIIHDSREHLAYFHANDRNLKGPGFGDVDFRPILAALRDVGYTGYVSIEVFRYDEGPETIARRGLAYLKECAAAGAGGGDS